MKKLLVLLIPFLLSGCLLESVGPIDRSVKPYGAHWTKEGMTQESRRFDLNDCGSIGNEDVQFTQEQLKNSTLPSDPNELNAFLRLRDQLGKCMRARGYQPIGDLRYLGGCDARCMYP
jgi:hypothetical protein